MRRTAKIVVFLSLLASADAQPLVRKFDASPRSVVAGSQVVLSWEVDKATEVRIDPDVGTVPRKGARAVSPTNDVTYTITAVDSAGVRRQAAVTVTVAAAPAADTASPTKMGLGRVTGRHLLPTGVSEDPGFGLYSYLLLGENENSRNRDRYLAILQQVIIEVTALADILPNKPDLRLVNVLYIPVRSRIELDERSPAAAAKAILKNYDFARAKLLLASIGDQYQAGPYFVSRLKPIQLANQVELPYLFQDLSHTDPSLASNWVKQFLRQAAREDPWNESNVAQFARKLRNEIQVIASFAVPVSWNTVAR